MVLVSNILNAVGGNSFAGGMKITDGATAWGLPEPSPFFESGGSPVFTPAASVPPTGMGNDAECPIHFGFEHGGYMYFLNNSAQGTSRGIYRYLLNANDPIGMTYDDWQARSNFTAGGQFWNVDGHIYSPADASVMVQTINTSGSLPYMLSRHDLSNWKFTTGNAIWAICPGHYTALVAQGVTRVAQPLLDRARNRLYVSSWGSCKVIAFNWTTGAFVGEWIIPGGADIAGTLQPFRMMGLDTATGYVLGGSFHANGGNGGIYWWDPSTPTAWSTVGPVVFQRLSTTWSRGRFQEYDAAPNHLRQYYGRYYIGMQPEDVAAVGFDSDDIVAKNFWPSYYGYSYGTPGFMRFNRGTGARQDIWMSRTNTYQRSGGGMSGLNLNQVIYIDGNPWILNASNGAIDHYNEQAAGPPNSNGIMGTHAGIGSNTLDISNLFTATATPKRIILSQAVGAVDAEFSASYAKWRISVDVNGGGYTTPRAGPAELHNLDSLVNGKAAWPAFLSTDTVTLKIECTSGMLHSFAPVQGNKGMLSTPNVGTADLGPPRDVIIELQHDEAGVLVDEGKTQGPTPIGVGVLDTAPVGLKVTEVP